MSGPTILELDLDLDAYAGPFDLLLALVLREEIDLVEVPVAEIVIEYIERLAEVEELDLEAVSEFLLLVAALCEVKARRLLGEGDSDIEEQGPEEAAAELAARLAEYQRFRAAAGWLGARRDELGRRFFRTVRAPLAPRPLPADLPEEQPVRARRGDRSPARAAAAPRHLRRPRAQRAGRPVPASASASSCARGATFVFDEQVEGLVARGAGGRVPRTARAVQARRAACRPGRGVRPDPGRADRRPARRSAGGGRARAGRRVSGELTHVVEALLFVSGEPLTIAELAAAAEAPPERVERALDALAERHAEGRSGVVLERVARGYGFRAAATTADACARLLQRAPDRALSPAALETLAVIAYLQPVGRPEITRIRGVSADAAVAGLLERGLIEEAGRTDERGGAVLYRTTTVFDRVFGLEEGVDELPPLPDLDEVDVDELRERLHAVAAERTG